MTENRMRNLAIEIARKKSKYSRLKAEAQGASVRLGGVKSGGVSDRVSAAAASLADLGAEIAKLETEHEEGFRRLNREIFEENCYFLKYKARYSWRRIATATMGRPDLEDVVRLKVRRYFKNYEW